jgi:hypothetical protein
MKFAYADPPYYKQGKKLYGKLHDQAKVWDAKEAHIDLINKLRIIKVIKKNPSIFLFY